MKFNKEKYVFFDKYVFSDEFINIYHTLDSRGLIRDGIFESTLISLVDNDEAYYSLVDIIHYIYFDGIMDDKELESHILTLLDYGYIEEKKPINYT